MTNKILGKGDIILVSNDPKPSDNREQKGKRPWLVISEPLVNATSPFVIAIPFTTSNRTYPLVYNWSKNNPTSKTEGVLLCNQLTTLDVKHREWKFLEHVEVPIEVDDIIQAILGYK
ncbi:type II toxin-antitoxin system PemK/MazF family toxin [Ligilactobacillus saerimneri]|uniref:type II toxin-antitoxin system PemK/MazF family toxin n=1 Tax=Ligilactobacillus saerimneri TaxID=228229 RepID=UPI000411E77B|nr:type II toxin-antitoxin system PemK/MazF family toxin [Ligilactobacillus saerimneri]